MVRCDVAARMARNQGVTVTTVTDGQNKPVTTVTHCQACEAKDREIEVLAAELHDLRGRLPTRPAAKRDRAEYMRNYRSAAKGENGRA